MKFKNPSKDILTEFDTSFKRSISFLKSCIGKKVFRPEGVFNVSVYESISVAVSKLIDEKGELDEIRFKKNYDNLIQNEEYKILTSRATSDDSVFRSRQDLTWRILNR